MAPKKKEQQKMSLGTFLQDEKLGSWADEMEDMPILVPVMVSGEGPRIPMRHTAVVAWPACYSVREELPLPDKPPYTVHLGNLSFDATVGDVTDFFADCDCTNVRIIEDKLEMKPKGFGYAEFGTREGLVKALSLGGSQFQGRNIRISVADPPKDRERPDARELTDWSRKGPLPDLPGRGSHDRRGPERGLGGEAVERRERREPSVQDDGKIRDFGNWERKGPLSPIPQQERQNSSRDGGSARTEDAGRTENFRERRQSPAPWGDSRPQDSQEGSRPPRREFQERPVVERVITAADQDNQWRSGMKPDAPIARPATFPGETNEIAPVSTPPNMPTGRPRLNLTKRTVSTTHEAPALMTSPGDAKASPFGAAKPIDTAAKEKEIEEKRVAALREKKESEEKARESKASLEASDTVDESKIDRAERESTDDQAQTVQSAEVRNMDDDQTIERENMNGVVTHDKSIKPQEVVREPKDRQVEAGAWRRPSNGSRRNEVTRAGRGGAPSRGGRTDVSRPARSEGVSSTAVDSSNSKDDSEPTPASLEEDGWSTVSKPKKNQRGVNQAARALAS